MASFREMKRRIGGVKNIQQITRAMKMIAGARLRRAEEAILALRPYASRLDRLCARFLDDAIGGALQSAYFTGVTEYLADPGSLDAILADIEVARTEEAEE